MGRRARGRGRGAGCAQRMEEGGGAREAWEDLGLRGEALKQWRPLIEECCAWWLDIQGVRKKTLGPAEEDKIGGDSGACGLRGAKRYALPARDG